MQSNIHMMLVRNCSSFSHLHVSPHASPLIHLFCHVFPRSFSPCSLTLFPSKKIISRSQQSTRCCLILLSSSKGHNRNHHLTVADLLAGLPTHGQRDPSLSSHHHPVSPLEGLSSHNTPGPMGDGLRPRWKWRVRIHRI